MMTKSFRIHGAFALAVAAVAACASSSPRREQAGAGSSMAEKHGHDGHHGHHGHHDFKNAAEWAQRFDDPARDEWQKPDDVVRAMQLSPGMTVADVGAGTGYFAVRLARAVPQGQVIATDLEPDMVKYLEERARKEGLANVRAVRATASASGLAPSSVDAILIVDVWHHIEDRATYARDLAAALRPGGRVWIVDFRLDSERGPPREMKLAPEAIMADLSGAGFVAKVSAVALPEQYVIEATRGP
jgi:cyclopropane fatty-acyl-phospholipid synthase-like methyltransferase